jgi:hypothetical protein
MGEGTDLRSHEHIDGRSLGPLLCREGAETEEH